MKVDILGGYTHIGVMFINHKTSAACETCRRSRIRYFISLTWRYGVRFIGKILCHLSIPIERKGWLFGLVTVNNVLTNFYRKIGFNGAFTNLKSLKKHGKRVWLSISSEFWNFCNEENAL